MKKIFVIFLLLISLGSNAQIPFQTRQTAMTLPKKSFEFAVFAPSRYGLFNHTEIYTNPFIDWQLPNLGLKQLWFVKHAKRDKGFFKSRDFYFSTVHNFDCPTMFLRSTQNHKSEFISDTSQIKFLFSMKNEFRVSTFLKRKTSCDAADFLFTLRLGVKNTFNYKDKSTFLPVNRPQLWYKETVCATDTVVWFVGADLDFHLTSKINFLADLDFYSVDWKVKDFSLESKLGVYGYFGKKNNMMWYGGLKFMVTTFDKHPSFRLLPMADFSYFFRFKKNRETGLFGEMR